MIPPWNDDLISIPVDPNHKWNSVLENLAQELNLNRNCNNYTWIYPIRADRKRYEPAKDASYQQVVKDMKANDWVMKFRVCF